ncbi:hypothetical protein AcV7_005787 [Taiwanofungus camphoratus]|nr:hypothetical protein AcV7_005787 [Antrodia cinnamomea]
MLAPYPYATRYRSNSSPPPRPSRSRPPISPEPTSLNPSTPRIRPLPTTIAPSKTGDHDPRSSAAPAHLDKHKSSRLKRTSSAKGRPREQGYPSHGNGPNAPAGASRRLPRAKLTARPSTSSGVPESRLTRMASPPSSSSGNRSSMSSGDPADWLSPLTHSSDLGVQRRKSRSSKGGSSQTDNESKKNNVQFSTVDRTILEELRRKIQARESQFIVRNGKKYHAFPVKEVPYPRSYEKRVVDLDVWCTMWSQQFIGSISWYLSDSPPTRVLDIGCGVGTWILEAARMWKHAHFIGLDVVPLHPDLQQVGSFDLASRITWVQANCLEGLPFPNEEFDFVNIGRIARGVPEDKWDPLFEEITRVLKPGGTFQLSDEDLYFPGILRKSSSPTRSSRQSDSTSTSGGSRASASSSPSQLLDQAYRVPLSSSPNISAEGFPWGHTPPAKSQDSLFRTSSTPPVNPHDHSLLEAIYNEMHAYRFINLEPLSLLSNLIPLYFTSVRSHPPLIIMFPPPPHIPVTDHTVKESQDSSAELFSIDRRQLNTAHSELRPKQTRPCGSADSEPNPHRLSKWVQLPQLVQNTEEYVQVDTTRFSALSPSPRSFSMSQSRSEKTSAQAASRRSTPGLASTSSNTLPPWKDLGLNRLPVDGVKFDLRSLNLHLSLRVQEVLACAEAMWDFVIDYQSSHLKEMPKPSPDFVGARQSRSNSAAVSPKIPRFRSDFIHTSLLEMTRSDFDDLLTRFELDMQDCMGFATVVETRLGWGPVAPSRTQQRKDFDAMCVAWAQYQDELRSAHEPDAPESPAAASLVPRSTARNTGDGDETVRPRKVSDLLKENLSRSQLSQDDDGPPPLRRVNPTPPSQRLSRTVRVWAALKA